MKRILITLLIVGSCVRALYAQVSDMDSVFKLLARTGQDSNRVLYLVELGGHYQFFNSDTALALTNQALEIARKLRFTRGEARAISRLGEVQHIRGELPQALEAELTAIQISSANGFPETEAESLTFIATIYLDLGDYRNALEYLFRAKKIYDNIAHPLSAGVAQQFPSYVLTNISVVYEKINNLDSALYYAKLALSYPAQLIKQLQADIFVTIGTIESRQKKYSEALGNFRRALAITETTNDLLNGSRALYQIATILNLQNKPDSAIHYARLAYLTGEQSSSKTYQLDAATLLVQLHKTKGNVDSAFHYQQTALNARDSLFGLDRFHKLQLLTLSEQQRVQQLKEEQVHSKARLQRTIFLFSVGIFLLVAFILWRSNRQQKKANRLLNEKNVHIEKQSERLQKALDELKAAQTQLIQREKMASLGELTAGIAHEIQNPLNFVNNFSEVNRELIAELQQEAINGNMEEIKALANSIDENEQKISQHGRRADAIVKGMLQHSRQGRGDKQPTDINALVDEHLRLTCHGAKAKDTDFHVALHTDFSPATGKVSVEPQEVGRVLINLFNNAFYAVSEKKKSLNGTFEPVVSVSTSRRTNAIEIRVADNGTGIPADVQNKIFQPFFTTKPTGQGTGLGLSLSYDIITKGYGGELIMESKEGEGATFIIRLPV